MEATNPTVALIYDFDGTLSAGNMQEYDFIPAVAKTIRDFWSESSQLARDADADPILTYMARMIAEARSSGVPITREGFRMSGSRVKLFPGVEEWFGRINRYGAEKGLHIVHYINSSGIREMIEGTSIAAEFRKIYACSFLYDDAGEAYWPGVSVNYTNKTQFIFKINKGLEPVWDAKAVNEFIPENLRPVPFRRMIYFGDGTTDIPCMRLVKSSGGYSIAVYDPSEEKVGSAGRSSGSAVSYAEESARRLLGENRVNFVSPADYGPDGLLDRIVHTIIDKIAAEVALASLCE
ncbi:MAG: haloacid dehalogenase-like hydrolase [Alistipes sp.]|jgi:phosphoserine phosphatase|nr:haloacid dehalogenase-like hydrolase [Alistipes sp.]